MVAQTRHTGQPSPKKLAFREKLVSKGQSNDALLKKLKTLHSELAEMDQEVVDVSSFSNVRKELISSSIMLHKDRGVKAYAACCLADILRLYAPDAPYTQGELRDIFQFFFKQLSANLKGDASYYNQYFHLLESLSTVKSVVLVCDLPNADELMLTIFRDLFALVRRDLPKKIETFMAEIMVALIDESASLSNDMLEIIMAQFMDKSARIEQPAYRLAVNVCNQTADKLQRNVALYFTDIIVSNSEEEDFDQIRTAHDLIKRLHASCPNLLPSVIPQLEEELHAESSTLRSIATQVLGEMFSDKSGGDLAKNHPSTWNAWLGRKVDKSPAVRLKFVEASKGSTLPLPEMVEAIEAAFQGKLIDPDEKVRVAACKLYSQLDYETAVHHVSESQLRSVAERVADRKPSVRFEAVNSLAKLYSLAYPEIENNDAAAILKFSWIPEELLVKAGSIPDSRSKHYIAHILPLPAYSPNPANGKTAEVDEVAWTDRLLNVMRYLSEKGVNALINLSNLKTRQVLQVPLYGSRPIDYFIDACVEYNGGVIDEDDEKVTQKLYKNHRVKSPDPAKMREDLKAFSNLNEARLYKLLRTCLDVDTDLKGMVKAHVKQSSSSLVPSMKTLLRQGALAHGTAVTKTNLAANHAQVLLTYVAKFCPALCKPHVDDLFAAVEEGKNDKTIAVGLQALAGVVRLDPALLPMDNSMEIVRTHALGSNHRHSKFAARILAFCEEKNEICPVIVETIADSLSLAPEDHLVAYLVLLSQFARFAPEAFEQKSDVITAFLLKKLLMLPSLPPEGVEDDEEEWVEDDDVSNNLKAKIVALKVLRYRSMAHADSKNALDISTPVLKMLASLLDHGGSMPNNEAVEEDRKALSRIRLQAAISLVHLSTVPAYAEALSPKFVRLALTVQDTCYNVRIGFLQKLLPLLYTRKLRAKYNVIPFLTAHDPEEDVKQKAASAISNSLRRLPPDVRTQNFEYIFIRLLHLLAHHPDFAISQSELQDIAKYVQFYLEIVGSEQSISLLYHLAGKGKTVRDIESQAHSENLYAMCEMAQELIKLRAQNNSWSIPTYPGKVKLPSDILRPQPNAEIANKIAKQTFLPPEAASWLAEITSAAPKEKKERRPPAKRKAATTNGHPKRSRKKRKQADSSDDDFGNTDGHTDVEMSEPPVHTSDVDDAEESGGEEKLGRGARSKAKARAKRKSRTSRKAGTPDSDG
ncbi:cohesin-associated protein Pds5 [Gymnopus androsaceus JB14]|uniref:Cohesin-associated protein Pds5 n=1 Tax=Gymnopus androsaceus JB14 TaxID=1447944 RepID=A0A6A4GRJ4_9AGAR|nr:cohesin-associated protein Pds5 [Gymnopus androsaceus JB14]